VPLQGERSKIREKEARKEREMRKEAKRKGAERRRGEMIHQIRLKDCGHCH
jgi:hypothetical protein